MTESRRRPLLDWISYPRAVFMIAFSAVSTAFCSVVIPILAGLTGSRRVVDWLIVNLWCTPLVRLAGVRVETRGAEYVRRDGKGFLLLFNHSSLWDIPVMFDGFPRSFRFGAKAELFKIPVFGWAMRVCGTLPINRANRNQVMRVYQESISRIDNGESFALAPEGTRQDGVQLGKFKRGPFEFAINAQAEIVPVVLAGVLKVLPKHSAWINLGRFRRRVILQVLPPVNAAEYTIERVEELQERVRALMEPAFIQLNQEINRSIS